MTFATKELLDASEVPPEIHGMMGWTMGAIGLGAAGQTVGEQGRETAVWPVGPRCFIVAAHVNWEQKIAIRYMGNDYSVVDVQVAWNDLVQLLVDRDIPSWHAVWSGGILNGLPIDIADKRVAIVSGGLGGCGLDPNDPTRLKAPDLGFKKRKWLYKGCWLTNRNHSQTTTPIGETVGPDICLPCNVGDDLTFGIVMGDSSGAVFIQDGVGWWISGLIMAGAGIKGLWAIAPLARYAPQANQSWYAGFASYHVNEPFEGGPTIPTLPWPVVVPEPPVVTVVVPPVTIPKTLRERLSDNIDTLESSLKILRAQIDESLGGKPATSSSTSAKNTQ